MLKGDNRSLDRGIDRYSCTDKFQLAVVTLAAAVAITEIVMGNESQSERALNQTYRFPHLNGWE